jgi:hypothetical protein
MKFTIDLGKSLSDVRKIMTKAAEDEISAAVKLGTRRASQYVLKEIITRIKKGKYGPLSEWTRVLKEIDGYSEAALVRKGSLLRALSVSVKSEVEGEIGLLLQKIGDGKNVNIGKVLHDGATIKMTPALKQAFARKVAAIRRKRPDVALPESKGASVIRIRARPFIKDVFEDPEVIAKIENIYIQTFNEKAEVLK